MRSKWHNTMDKTKADARGQLGAGAEGEKHGAHGTSDATLEPPDQTQNVPLLAGRVPNLQLDLLPADLNDARAKLDADRVRAVSHELLLRELVKDA